MKTLDLFFYAKEQMQNLDSSISLVILHPDFYGQHRLFAASWLGDDAVPVFVSLPSPDLSLAEFLDLLNEALNIQLGDDIPAFPAAPEAAASTVAGILNAHDPIRLIIDAYDLADQADVAPFMVALSQQLDVGARIIISTRQLPMDLLAYDDLRGKMALVPVNPDKMILDYASHSEKTLLEVRALGPGRVLVNGRLIEHWDGVLPRTLFFYFVDRGMTTRDEIFQTFWPTLSTREATNVFHVTKRKISEILGTDLTVYWSGFYRISPDINLQYDVVRFAEAVQNAAVATDEEAIALLNNAVELYHGPFLSTLDQEWVKSRREELASSYAEALTGTARIHKLHDDKQDALGYFLRAAATSPQREDLARAIMELYQALGLPAAALDTYERLEGELKRSLNVAPGPETQSLASAIRASM